MDHFSHTKAETNEPSLRAYLKDKFDISEQKNIKKHLKDLEKAGCIKKIPTKGLANVWLIDDIKKVRKIAETFNDLIPPLSKSECIIKIIIDSFLGENADRDACDDCFDTVHLYRVRIPEWFKLSPSFFEYFLYTDRSLIINRLQDCSNQIQIHRKNFRGRYNKINEWQEIEVIFELCIKYDILYGRSNPEAMEWLIQKGETETRNTEQFYFSLITKHDFQLAELSAGKRREYFKIVKEFFPNGLGALGMYPKWEIQKLINGMKDVLKRENDLINEYNLESMSLTSE